MEGLDVVDFPGVDDEDGTIPDLADLLVTVAQIVIFVVDYRCMIINYVCMHKHACVYTCVCVHACVRASKNVYVNIITCVLVIFVVD